MTQIARLGLMVFAFFTIFFISELVQKAHHHSEVVFLEHFVGFTFLLVTLSLTAWIFCIHRIVKYDSIPFLKELLYVFVFISFFMTVASFIGYC